MSTFKPLTERSGQFAHAASSDIDLLKIQISVESTVDESSAANFAIAGTSGYNPFVPSVSTEADAETEDPKTEEEPETEPSKPDTKDQTKSGVVANMKNGASAAVSQVKNMAVKAADFTKSSVGKVNNMPVDQTQKAINERIVAAKDDPKNLSKMVNDGLKSAGKGAALTGLAILSLPIAAGALVKYKMHDNKMKQAGAEQLGRDLIKIKMEIEKADRDGDLDKKADLLILQRQTEQAFAKLKYGIKVDIKKTGDA